MSAPAQAQQAARQAAAAAPPAAAAAAEQAPLAAADPRAGKCQYYMQKKQRHCKFDVVPGKAYCGNHLYFQEGEGPKRVPCPWDPKGSHMVAEANLEKHKAKCPSYQLWLAERARPFFCQGINGGPPEEEVAWPPGLAPLAPPAPPPEAAANEADAAAEAAGAARKKQRARKARPAQGAAGLAAAYAASLGPERFEELLRRIEAACEQVCGAEPLRVEVPPEAEPLLLPESATHNRPFSLKHAQQQASIVGNMKAAGLLAGAEATTYIEFGAGKGYLCHMLASCTPAVSKVVMMDVRGFKEKADRSMRHLEMQRLRCDIADFHVAQVEGLQGGAAPWVAFGKHLCGAATDFTLRSCARERQRQLASQQQPQQAQPAAAAEAAQQHAAAEAAEQQAAAAPAPAGPIPASGGVRGLAVATCCHHRCSWRHFVGQEVMAELGFHPREFEVIAWMTGWALCGHEAPAGFGGSDEEGEGKGGKEEPQQAAAAAQPSSHKRGREEAEQPAPPAPAAPAAAGVAGSAADADMPEAAAPAAAAPDEQQQGGEGGEGQWRPQWALPRERKIAVGQRCKRLIDSARLVWLGRQGFDASLVRAPQTPSMDATVELAEGPCHAEVTPGPLELDKYVGLVGDGGAGAIATFVGVTRNCFQGKRTERLEYEAYVPMAARKLLELCRQACARWQLCRVAIAHRTGTVYVGEASVIIAVSSAHRREALEACAWAIDELKATVPIWKKEFFEGGEVWKENEEWRAQQAALRHAGDGGGGGGSAAPAPAAEQQPAEVDAGS